MKELITDYKDYLDEILKLSKDLDKEQQIQLFDLIKTHLMFLISFKRFSNLGGISNKAKWRL